MRLADVRSRYDLPAVLNTQKLTGEGIEIGVALGLNARHILRHWNGAKLWLIDPYDVDVCGEYVDLTANMDMEKNLANMQRILEPHKNRYELVRETSDNAFVNFRQHQMDFIYIDGNHHAPQITNDLNNYWGLLRRGGLFAGHDFYMHDSEDYRCEVEEEVRKFLFKRQYKRFHTSPLCTSWYVIK